MQYLKTIGIIFILLFSFTSSFAQLGINTDGADPNSSAMLDVKSNDKGILIPRMTEMQKNEITVAAAQEGLMVYQTDGTKGFYYYNGSAWTLVGDGTADADANATNEAQTLSVSGGASPAISLSQVNSTGGGTVNLVAGTNVSLAQSGSNVTINSTSSGGGGSGFPFTMNINGADPSTLGISYIDWNGALPLLYSSTGYYVRLETPEFSSIIQDRSVYFSNSDCTGTAVVLSAQRSEVFEVGTSGTLGYVPKDANVVASFTPGSRHSSTSGCAVYTTVRNNYFPCETTGVSAATGITLSADTPYEVKID